MSTIIKIESASSRTARRTPYLELSGNLVLDMLLICGEYATGRLSRIESIRLLLSLDVMCYAECLNLLNSLERENIAPFFKMDTCADTDAKE